MRWRTQKKYVPINHVKYILKTTHSWTITFSNLNKSSAWLGSQMCNLTVHHTSCKFFQSIYDAANFGNFLNLRWNVLDGMGLHRLHWKYFGVTEKLIFVHNKNFAKWDLMQCCSNIWFRREYSSKIRLFHAPTRTTLSGSLMLHY